MSSKVATKALGSETGFRATAGLYDAGGGRKYLNAVERTRVLGAAASLTHPKELFVALLAWTGARISEILALDARSFQIDRNLVSIATLKRRRYLVREVPIPPALMSQLNVEFRLEELQRDADDAHRRLWPYHRVTVWRWIKHVMLKASITGASACPRGFRHGFGVGAVQASIPLNLVQRWLGHARLTTTAIYTEVTGPEEYAFAARLWDAAEPLTPEDGTVKLPAEQLPVIARPSD